MYTAVGLLIVHSIMIVKQQMEETSVNDVLEKNWPGLHIEPLQAPENMEVLIDGQVLLHHHHIWLVK